MILGPSSTCRKTQRETMRKVLLELLEQVLSGSSMPDITQPKKEVLTILVTEFSFQNTCAGC